MGGVALRSVSHREPHFCPSAYLPLLQVARPPGSHYTQRRGGWTSLFSDGNCEGSERALVACQRPQQSRAGGPGGSDEDTFLPGVPSPQ